MTDVVVPGAIIGFALANLEKELYPDIRVEFMSSYAADAIKMDDPKENDYLLLRKPIRMQEFSDMKRAVLDRREALYIH